LTATPRCDDAQRTTPAPKEALPADLAVEKMLAL
jgi:hypothetical protein